MTAISKYPEQPHVVVIEPSTTAASVTSASPTTTTALNENDNSNNINGTIVVDVDDTSKRKWRYCSSDNADDEDGEGDADVEDGEENEANCSGYDDDLIRISSPVPTFPNIPWSRSRKYHPDLEGLHYELLECYDWLRPTEAERFARVNVCQRVRNVLVDICPDAIFYVFGSVATNLFLPTSDIDISVELQRLTQYDMQIVAAAFRNSKNFKDVNVLDRVHVPIIKLTDRETSINIDISFNTSNAHSAVQYIMYMRFWYPAVELFTLILKQFLATRQLNQAFTGGLSSYGLILMIVHYMLRHYRNIFFAKDLSQLPIGILSKFLMGFLEYYGQKFNPLNDALAFPRFDEAVLMSKSHLTSMMNEDFFASILCIQDPLTPVNDVGRGCHNFMHVRAAFLSAWTTLKKKLELNRSMRCGKPMLESIMTFSNNFVQFRRKINCLPFENICEHDGNTPYIFGGQPLQEMGYETEARNVVLYPAGGILPLPRMYFPAPVAAAATSPSFLRQQQHFQAQQQGQGGYDENGCIEQISTSSSEASSTTPTAFSSPRGPTADFQQSEYYSNTFQFPPHHHQQQIFFPPFQQQHPRQIYSYNPYFAAAAGLSPTSFQQPLFPPPFHHHHLQHQQYYGNGNDISDYGNSSNNEYSSSNNGNGEYCGYSDAYYSPEDAHHHQSQQSQQDMISEDDFNKMLSFNSAVEDENDDSKCSSNNNGNISDDSSTSSSGLSTGSSDSIISCSTVTPELYDDQFSTTTSAPSVTTEKCSMKSGS